MRTVARISVAAASVVIVAAGLLFATGTATQPQEATATEAQPTSAATTDAVTRRTLQHAEEFEASVGYGDQFALPGSATGTVTWVPEKGSLLRPGQVLYRLDERPTLWTQANVPMYRALGSGSKGVDVEELQQFLKEQGYLDAEVETDGEYGGLTRDAVKAWQEDHGLEETGRIDASQLLFLPYAALRVASVPRIGDLASPGVLEVTLPHLFATVDVSALNRRAFEGDPVISIETADGSRYPATVESISAQQEQDGSGRQRYHVRLNVETPPGQEPGEATIEVVDVLAEDVLTVPVRALLALSEGGYAVEIAPQGGPSRYVSVEIGEFSDGWVEVVGDVVEGDPVVVAS